MISSLGCVLVVVASAMAVAGLLEGGGLKEGVAVTGVVGLDGKIYPVSDLQVSTMPTHHET